MSDETAKDEAETRSPEEIRADIDQTREELGDTVEALAAKTDVKGRAKDKAQETKEKVTAKARAATPDSASQGAQQAAGVVRENPDYAIYAGLFVAGLIAGWVIRGR